MSEHVRARDIDASDVCIDEPFMMSTASMNEAMLFFTSVVDAPLLST